MEVTKIFGALAKKNLPKEKIYFKWKNHFFFFFTEVHMLIPKPPYFSGPTLGGNLEVSLKHRRSLSAENREIRETIKESGETKDALAEIFLFCHFYFFLSFVEVKHFISGQLAL